MEKKPLKRRFRPNLNTFACAFAVLAFFVLAAFMVSTPMINPGFSIDKPKVAHPKTMPRADGYDALIVSVARTGDIYFKTEKVSSHRLILMLRDALKHDVERKVYIKADRQTKVGNVNEVVDAVRSAGIENVAFLTEERPPSAPKTN